LQILELDSENRTPTPVKFRCHHSLRSVHFSRHALPVFV